MSLAAATGSNISTIMKVLIFITISHLIKAVLFLPYTFHFVDPRFFGVQMNTSENPIPKKDDYLP